MATKDLALNNTSLTVQSVSLLFGGRFVHVASLPANPALLTADHARLIFGGDVDGALRQLTQFAGAKVKGSNDGTA
jgi:hypothetical protein